MSFLFNEAIESWDSVVDPADVVDRDANRGESGASSSTSFVPGLPADAKPGDTLAAQHAEMMNMIYMGWLPKTTEAQRLKYTMKKSSSSYRVPPGMEFAFLHGYVSPNLPPPRGYKWLCKGGKWILLQLGG